MKSLLRLRRQSPRADLTSCLTRSGDGLSDDEVASVAANMLVISHEPVLSQISCSLVALLQVLRTIDACVSDDMLQAIVKETIRLEPSEDYAERIVTEPIEIGGVLRGSGTLVYCSLAAANRDPAVWRDADQFQPQRFLLSGCAPILSFGGGAHHCVGSALVRMIISEIFRRIVDIPMVLAVAVTELEWVRILGARPVRLPVRC